MRNTKTMILGLLLILLASSFAAANGEIKIPKLSGPVVDQVGLLKPGKKGQLERMLYTIDQSGKAQTAILIASSLQGYDIESFSLKVVESWKLGAKKSDNGLLLVIAPKERRMRFEVGYGLEGDITDLFSKRIQRNVLVPYFREGRFGDGLMIAVEEIAKQLKIDLSAPVKSRIKQGQRRGKFPWFLLFALLVGGWPLFMAMFFGGAVRRGGWYGGSGWGGGGFGGGGFGGGGFGGGGFSGGGGSFGGGGASSSW